MKKILVMPVKNEEWILEKSLACGSLWADHIIIADQNSTDKTLEICKKFKKVICIKNESKGYNEGLRRQLLLDAARSFDGCNFIANLAADEIFSSNILKSESYDRLVENRAPGTGFLFQWIQLWRSESLFRSDGSMWAKSYMPFAFIDDRKANFQPGFAHLSRIPEPMLGKALKIEEIKVLHYQFVDFERMLSKQRWARVLEFAHINKSDFLTSLKLNHKYYVTKNEHGLRTEPAPAEWFNGYPEVPIKKFNGDWRNDTVKKNIEELGTERLKWLDIWDYNWGEGKTDPRGWLQKLYQKNQYGIFLVSNIIPGWLKKIIKKIIF